MRRVQAVGLAGIAAAAAVTLAGCEKPAPGVSVFSGTGTVRSEALCWAFDSDQLAPGQCAADVLSGQAAGDVPSLQVQGGDTVGISVDQAVAEAGWTLAIDGKAVTPEMTSTYFRFPLNVVLDPQTNTRLQVVAGRSGQQRGIWVFQLTPAAS